MPKISQSIFDFLNARKTPANSDLIDRLNIGMELQCNVAVDNGEPVEGKRSTYTDGTNEWFNFRIPHHADSEPEWKDFEIHWPLDLHAEGIGCTGWSWKEKVSKWVAFDVDSLISHAAGVGISDIDLEKVKIAAQTLPYIEVRHSTGGKGQHLYCYLDNIPTENHTVHAALARCILGLMSSVTGFDFASHIDVCGSNMWIWHRKITKENHGLEIIKAATQMLTLDDLPPNWRDHIEVVTRQRAKIRVTDVTTEQEDPFESLANSRRIVPLDEQHKAIIDELGQCGFSTIWVSDYHLLQTHTKAFEEISGKYKGVFKTVSEGRHPATCNCFAFPLPNGAWKVYRFSQGTNEAETWEQDSGGWTTCFFNRPADLHTASRAKGGAEAPNSGGYVFETAQDAAEVVKNLGHSVVIPEGFQDRETKLKAQKDGRVTISIDKNKGEDVPKGWVSNNHGKITRVLNVKAELEGPVNEESFSEYDKVVRFLVTPENKSAGWCARAGNGRWIDATRDVVSGQLLITGLAKTEVDLVAANIWSRHWCLVNLPFQPEYPGDRQWNLDAAQFKVPPSDTDNPQHPHWDMILNHCFGSLDIAIKKAEWSDRLKIKSGYDYGLAWMACALRDPFQPLPYLFLYGGENCGKSTFHESFSCLITKGIESANQALTSQSGFNGELAGAIIAYVEEIDISKTPGAHSKLKEWVVARMIPIRRMRTDTYLIPNKLKIIQVANHPENCPIFPGDTRIDMIYVPPLPDNVEIPKIKLMEFLALEAGDFLRTLMNLELPVAEGRMHLPIVETENKSRMQDSRRTPIERFLAENCYSIPGVKISLEEFQIRFSEWIDPLDKQKWESQDVIIRNLQKTYPVGKSTDNKKFIGNISWDKDAKPGTPWYSEGNKLKRNLEN